MREGTRLHFVNVGGHALFASDKLRALEGGPSPSIRKLPELFETRDGLGDPHADVSA